MKLSCLKWESCYWYFYIKVRFVAVYDHVFSIFVQWILVKYIGLDIWLTYIYARCKQPFMCYRKIDECKKLPIVKEKGNGSAFFFCGWCVFYENGCSESPHLTNVKIKLSDKCIWTCEDSGAHPFKIVE